MKFYNVGVEEFDIKKFHPSPFGPSYKPNGYWGAPMTSNGLTTWEQYRKDLGLTSEYGFQRVKTSFEVDITSDRVLKIAHFNDYVALVKGEYGYNNRAMNSNMYVFERDVNWRKVLESGNFDALYIDWDTLFPELEDIRKEGLDRSFDDREMANFLYTFSCESICIFNADVMENIQTIEVRSLI